MNPFISASIILFYFILLIIISLVTSKNSDNTTFFRGNRKAPWYVIAIGMVGASLSGVTFISVPGWVEAQQFTYIQTVLGFVLGYIVIANLLLPLYYKLKLPSIYSYLNTRFGFWSYKSGSLLFIISRSIGSAARLYLMANVLQIAVFDAVGIPFHFSVFITIGLIWLYTFKGGIKTIIWTDVFQTLFLIGALIGTIIFVGIEMDLSLKGIVATISNSEHAKIFVFDDWKSSQHFVKQFISGAFITLVMTGLDQDMMQKNLACKNLIDAKKNVYLYGFAFLPMNILFLSLGALLYIFMAQTGIEAPAKADDMYPMLALGGYLPITVGIMFLLGLVAAAYSSADSALTSLTTAFSIDILEINKLSETKARTTRIIVHICFTILMAFIILIFKILHQDSIIDTIYVLAGYTYGPLLGLYAFGLFTKYIIKDKLVIFAAVLPPIITGIIDFNAEKWFGFRLGYEKLILNGLLTFLILWVIRE
ncbi:MAG: sodium:solute symporter [Marinilabiliaceae bacterium]|nr:sodium:solute symporter [Marinilabiliaceae bacterium]